MISPDLLEMLRPELSISAVARSVTRSSISADANPDSGAVCTDTTFLRVVFPLAGSLKRHVMSF